MCLISEIAILESKICWLIIQKKNKIKEAPLISWASGEEHNIYKERDWFSKKGEEKMKEREESDEKTIARA